VKTLLAVLLSLGAGAAVGAAAVAGVTAVVNPDTAAVEQSDQQPVDVLDYGTRG
jgi:uncharacterized protein DUF2613